MPDGLLVLLHDLGASVAVLLGPSTLTSVLVLVGATTLAAAAVALLARGARTPALVLVPVVPGRVRDALDLLPSVAQSDPDAPGRPRPRAPGPVLG